MGFRPFSQNPHLGWRHLGVIEQSGEDINSFDYISNKILNRVKNDNLISN
ncbi:MAG: hypothetical protein RJA13_452 [Bacteroidota bacterium]